MKTLFKHHRLEKGQIFPIVVFFMITMIMMGALILDGGGLMLNKRAAQNAADAAALAGARVFCNQETYNWADIEGEIVKYTEENNATFLGPYPPDNPDPSNVGVDGLVKGEIVVSVEVENKSFLAKIFDQDQNVLNAKATAAAGCFPYQADIVLPIAYPCRPPVTECPPENPECVISESGVCDYVPLDWSVVKDYVYPPGAEKVSADVKTTSETLYYGTDEKPSYQENIYIVVDTLLVCGEDLNCDLYGDDSLDRYNLNSSQRGWLNLEGVSPGTDTLRDWVLEGVPGGVEEHTWLSFYPGNRGGPGFGAMDTRLNEIVWVPVFNKICGTDDIGDDKEFGPEDKCYQDAHKDPFSGPIGKTCEINMFQNDYPVAHVVAFAPFFPTCTMKNSDAWYYKQNYKKEKCPGFAKAQAENMDPDKENTTLIPDNTAALEGYFIDPDSLGGGDNVSIGGVDLGYYIAVLTR